MHLDHGLPRNKSALAAGPSLSSAMTFNSIIRIAETKVQTRRVLRNSEHLKSGAGPRWSSDAAEGSGSLAAWIQSFKKLEFGTFPIPPPLPCTTA